MWLQQEQSQCSDCLAGGQCSDCQAQKGWHAQTYLYEMEHVELPAGANWYCVVAAHSDLFQGTRKGHPIDAGISCVPTAGYPQGAPLPYTGASPTVYGRGAP